MKKGLALFLTLLVLINFAMGVSAQTLDLSKCLLATNHNFENEVSGYSESETDAPLFFEVAGYKIPTETGVSLSSKNSYSFTDGECLFTLFSGANEDYILSELYANGKLKQKSIGIKNLFVIYTEIYDLETKDESASAEPIISNENDMVSIVVHKEINPQTAPMNSIQAKPVQASAQNDPFYYEPALDTGLTVSPYQDDAGFYKLGSSQTRYGGGDPTYTGTLYRRRNSFTYAGRAREPYEIQPNTAISVVSTFIGFFVDPTRVSFVLGLLSLSGEVVTYLTRIEVDVYNLTATYKVRIDSAGNNVYHTNQRTISYYRLFNTAKERMVYEMRRIENGYLLDNPSMVNQGISNYTEYHFYDIINHWAKESIKWCYQKGYLSGTSTYAFSPSNSASRVMAITSVYRMAGSPPSGTSTPFSDVPASAYYAKAVSWGVKNGIISGTSPTTFSPNSLLTREQMAVILYNYAKYKGKNVNVSGDLNKFVDGTTVSSWALTEMKWAVGKGIFSGNDKGYLNPRNKVARGELATLLQSFTNRA